MGLPKPEQVAAAKNFVLANASPPRVGVVLGSGLGTFADKLGDLVRLPYADIPHMPTSAVPGHAGNLCLGTFRDVQVACLQGRVHAYEGYEMARVVFAVSLLASLGCESVLLTNAAGGIGEAYTPGRLMLINDHLNLTGLNPLVGPNDGGGPRFPDMSHAYDPTLQALARTVASEQGVALVEGVYAGMLGPTYETPAEIRMLSTLGASAVGMSTVLEVIALRYYGVKVGAISCITNLAAGLSQQQLNHREVEEVAALARERFEALVGGWIGKLGGAGV